MWKEIKLDDVDFEDSMKEFVRVQKLCSEFYAKSLIAEACIADAKRLQSLGVRAFMWRDKDYEMNLSTILRDKDTIHLRTIGIGKCADVKTAIDLTIPLFKQLMAEHNTPKLYAIWGDDVYPNVQEYYMGLANGLDRFAFTNSVLTTPRAKVRVINSNLAITPLPK